MLGVFAGVRHVEAHARRRGFELDVDRRLRHPSRTATAWAPSSAGRRRSARHHPRSRCAGRPWCRGDTPTALTNLGLSHEVQLRMFGLQVSERERDPPVARSPRPVAVARGPHLAHDTSERDRSRHRQGLLEATGRIGLAADVGSPCRCRTDRWSASLRAPATTAPRHPRRGRSPCGRSRRTRSARSLPGASRSGVPSGRRPCRRRDRSGQSAGGSPRYRPTPRRGARSTRAWPGSGSAAARPERTRPVRRRGRSTRSTTIRSTTRLRGRPGAPVRRRSRARRAYSVFTASPDPPGTPTPAACRCTPRRTGPRGPTAPWPVTRSRR